MAGLKYVYRIYDIMVSLGKPRDKLPFAEMYFPPKEEREALIREGDREKARVDYGPFVRLGILAAILLVNLAVDVYAGVQLHREGLGVLPILGALVIPLIVCWFFFFEADMLFGGQLAAPAVLIWIAVWIGVQTPSSLWLFIAALVTSLTMGLGILRYSRRQSSDVVLGSVASM